MSVVTLEGNTLTDAAHCVWRVGATLDGTCLGKSLSGMHLREHQGEVSGASKSNGECQKYFPPVSGQLG